VKVQILRSKLEEKLLQRQVVSQLISFRSYPLYLYSLYILFTGVARDSLHIDESAQVQTYGKGIKEAIGSSLNMMQPPLNQVFGWLSTQTLGQSIWAYRLPSALFAFGAIVFLHKYLNQVWSFEYSAITIVVLLSSEVFLRYSTYARPYSITIFFLSFGLYLSSKIQNKQTEIALACTLVMLPWTRLIEGIAAGSILLTLLIFQGKKSESRNFGFLFSLSLSYLASSVASALLLTRMNSSFVSKDINLWEIIETIKIVLSTSILDLSGVEIEKSLLIFLIIFLIVILQYRDNWKLLFVMTSLFVFAILIPILIIVSSVIPFFPRYLYFGLLSFVLLKVMLIEIVQKIFGNKISFVVKTLIVVQAIVISIPLATQERFPPFSRADEIVKSIKKETPDAVFYALLPNPMNNYLPGWPFNPEGSSGLNWLPYFVRDASPFPTNILIFPSVNSSFEVIQASSQQESKIGKNEKHGNLLQFSLGKDASQQLVELSKNDFGGSEFWLALAGLKMGFLEGNDSVVKNAQMVICPSEDVVISLGAVFGEWNSPDMTLNQFLNRVGLPQCQRG